MQVRYMTPEIDVHDYEWHAPRYLCEEDGKAIKFITPTEISRNRAEKIAEFEPETLAWIRSFAENELLFDIGANVGTYSLYAAIMRGARAVAFEPESQGYGNLNYNIFLNAMSDRITAYNIAISDHEGLTNMYLNYFGAGVSCSAVEEPVCNYDAFNQKGLEKFTPKYVQGVFMSSLDRLVYDHGVPVPDYIKIDIDGFEHKVIKGADRLLRSGQVKSLLVEINQFMQEHKNIIDYLDGLGYDKQDIGTANLIFTRRS